MAKKPGEISTSGAGDDLIGGVLLDSSHRDSKSLGKPRRTDEAGTDSPLDQVRSKFYELCRRLFGDIIARAIFVESRMALKFGSATTFVFVVRNKRIKGLLFTDVSRILATLWGVALDNQYSLKVVNDTYRGILLKEIVRRRRAYTQNNASEIQVVRDTLSNLDDINQTFADILEPERFEHLLYKIEDNIRDYFDLSIESFAALIAERFPEANRELFIRRVVAAADEASSTRYADNVASDTGPLPPQSLSPRLPLPEARYVTHTTSGSALNFFDRVWRTYITGEASFRLGDLRTADPKLLAAIYAECREQRMRPRTFLPGRLYEPTAAELLPILAEGSAERRLAEIREQTRIRTAKARAKKIPTP